MDGLPSDHQGPLIEHLDMLEDRPVHRHALHGLASLITWPEPKQGASKSLMDLLASAMPNEFTPATTTRMKKTTGMNAGPDPKQQREDHTRETHVRPHAPGRYTPGPRPLLAGARGNTRLETRVSEDACIHCTCDACIHCTCDACIHCTCDAGLHWTCDADLHTRT